MYLTTFGICFLKNMGLIHILSTSVLVRQVDFKKIEIKLDLLSGIDMLLMVEKDIKGEICTATHRYTKANNKYMNDFYKSKESLDLNYLDVNKLYLKAISQKLPVGSFK